MNFSDLMQGQMKVAQTNAKEDLRFVLADAKAGIAGMTLTMARDLGSLGIRVMTIAPSLFHTGLTQWMPEERAESLVVDAAFPKRMGRPDEFARLAISIIENPMLNGGTIRLDAGQRFGPKVGGPKVTRPSSNQR